MKLANQISTAVEEGQDITNRVVVPTEEEEEEEVMLTTEPY